MAKNVWHNIENFNPLIVFNDANSPTKACHVKCASKRGTKVGPLFQVNSDRSKNLNKFFLKVYFASKLIQSDIKFSNRWTRRLFVFLAPRCFALCCMFTIIPILSLFRQCVSSAMTSSPTCEVDSPMCNVSLPMSKRLLKKGLKCIYKYQRKNMSPLLWDELFVLAWKYSSTALFCRV